jgi:hypothetical protein
MLKASSLYCVIVKKINMHNVKIAALVEAWEEFI